MKNLMALVKLENSFIVRYWKYVLMFFGIALLMGVVQDGVSFMFSLMIFAASLTLFAFEFAEKSNLNVLYGTLPTNRSSIVFAKYLYMIVILLVSAVIALLGAVILELGFGRSIDATLVFAVLAMAAGIYLLFTAWNTPFMFKLGYIKGRIFFWVFIAAIMIVFFLEPLLGAFNIDISFNIFLIAFGDVVLTSLIALAIGATAFLASYFISQRIYKNKDF